MREPDVCRARTVVEMEKVGVIGEFRARRYCEWGFGVKVSVPGAGGFEVARSRPVAGFRYPGTRSGTNGKSDPASGASVEVGTSSDSVDVDVFVRYNAVCNAVAASGAIAVGSQFQTPRSGKRFSTIPPLLPLQSAPHAAPTKFVKVQPLGSSMVLTPVA